MAVGQQASVAGVNQAMTSLASRWRDLTEDTLQELAFLNKLGTAGLNNLGGANAGFSLAANPANPGSQSDAAYVLTLIGYMATCAQVFQGLFGQAAAGQTASDFNFQDATTILWGDRQF